jgi:hypothetical protein
MEQHNNAGSLERLYIACFRPSRYKELLDAPRWRHVVYFALVILLLVVIEGVLPFAAWDLSVGGLKGLITNRLPAFTVENGKMDMEQPVEFDIAGIIHVKADSSVDQYKKDDLDKKYQEDFLISSSNIIVGMGDRVMDVPLTELGDQKFDNQALAETVPVFRILLLIYFLTTYVINAGEYLISALFFAILCRAIIRTPDGKYVTFKKTLAIAIYAKTLFSILHSVHNCIGRPLSETLVLILLTFGTVMYIYKAEATVLDILPRK